MKNLRRYILSISAAVVGAALIAPNALAATQAEWSDWKPSNEPLIQYRYQVHGRVAAKLQFKSANAASVMVRFKWMCAPSGKFVQTVPEGYVQVPARGVSIEQGVGVEDCVNPTPSAVQVSYQ